MSVLFEYVIMHLSYFEGDKFMKKITILIAFLVLLLLPIDANAASKVKLSATKKTVTVGKTIKISLKNNKKKVKWSVSNSKIKIVKKTNEYVKIKAVKKGTATLKAKVGKKTYKCKITVKKNLTMKQAKAKLRKWIAKNGHESSGAILRYDHMDGDNYVFQYYHDMGTHTATMNWYYVNKKTGKIKAMF